MSKHKFSKVVNIISGGTPNTSIKEYWNGNIGWLSVVDFVNKNKYVDSSEKTITELGVENSSTKILNHNDIIISARGTVGAMAMLKIPMAFNQSCFGLRAKPEYLNQDFLFYYLKNYMKNLKAKTQGSVFETINLATFDMLEIDFPDIPKQKKIAELLSVIDDKIEPNNKINAELEAMAKTLYDYWFLQFEFPNEDGKPYKSSGGKMVWNEELKREIPEGWEIGNLYDIADFINGLACQKYRPVNDTEKLPVIKITEMHDGITDNTEFVRSDIPENNIINDGDILFSWSATLETMIWTGGKCGLNQHIFKVIPKNISKYYVFMQLSSYIGNFVKMAEARKTTMGHITTEHLKQSKIVLPNKTIAEMFDKKIFDVFQMIIKNNQEKRELINVRDFLLPLLMNGQVGFKE